MMTMTADTHGARLRVRKPKVDFSSTPKYWVLNDPQSTHALNILHFGIPAGERYFIDGVRLALPYITDRRLQADARAFMGQEAVHARIHERAADHLDLSSIPVIRGRVEAADRTREALYRRVDALPEPLRRQATLIWLSGTMLGEHFTALFADIIFDSTKFDESAFDPQMVQVLRWHAAEELEHRTVPYDIYQHLGGRYLTRVVPAIPAFVLLPVELFGITSMLMMIDRDIRRPVSIVGYVRAVRGRRTPNLLDVMAKLPAYLLPNYHPSPLGNDARARAWLASNPPSLAHLSAGSRRSAGSN
jgi:predicted metal-dependent hydrolase